MPMHLLCLQPHRSTLDVPLPHPPRLVPPNCPSPHDRRPYLACVSGQEDARTARPYVHLRIPYWWSIGSRSGDEGNRMGGRRRSDETPQCSQRPSLTPPPPPHQTSRHRPSSPNNESEPETQRDPLPLLRPPNTLPARKIQGKRTSTTTALSHRNAMAADLKHLIFLRCRNPPPLPHPHHLNNNSPTHVRTSSPSS